MSPCSSMVSGRGLSSGVSYTLQLPQKNVTLECHALHAYSLAVRAGAQINRRETPPSPSTCAPCPRAFRCAHALSLPKGWNRFGSRRPPLGTAALARPASSSNPAIARSQQWSWDFRLSDRDSPQPRCFRAALPRTARTRCASPLGDHVTRANASPFAPTIKLARLFPACIHEPDLAARACRRWLDRR